MHIKENFKYAFFFSTEDWHNHESDMLGQKRIRIEVE